MSNNRKPKKRRKESAGKSEKGKGDLEKEKVLESLKNKGGPTIPVSAQKGQVDINNLMWEQMKQFDSFNKTKKNNVGIDEASKKQMEKSDFSFKK